MISSITQASLAAPADSSRKPSAGGGAFDAALKAAEADAQRRQAHHQEMAQIAEKGFSAWVRDTRIEKLKEELRKKIMAEMGLDADQLGKMEAVARQVIEQKIEDEIERRLAEATEQEQSGKGVTQLGKNDRRGPACPVIPALVESGGESVF